MSDLNNGNTKSVEEKLEQVRANETKSGNEHTFSPRTLWPDIIKCPQNSWVCGCDEIVARLGADEGTIQNSKKTMEKCLIYFHKMRKELKLFDHTYTAACLLFYRYWFKYDLPRSLPECIHLSHAILVTACKTMENNRPTDQYIKSTCDFLFKDVSENLAQRSNIEKLKWEVRDQLVAHEKKVLCRLGFDFALDNAKELLEEIFSGYYRHVRDSDMDENFKAIFPAILQEARNFIIQTGTQPITLLCDGYSLVAASLVYSGATFRKTKDEAFRFPANFFRNRFPVSVDPDSMERLFSDYRTIEKRFFDLKNNKGDSLIISSQEISAIIDEDYEEEPSNPYDYSNFKDGEAGEELLGYTERKVEELINRVILESSSKRPATPGPERSQKKQKI